MKKILRQGFLLGLGAVSLTRKQAEKMVKQFVKKGIVNSKEGRALVKRVLTEAKKQETKLRKLGETEAKKALKEAGIVSLAEAKRLKKKVKVLEKKLKKKGRKTAKKIYKKVKRKLR